MRIWPTLVLISLIAAGGSVRTQAQADAPPPPGPERVMIFFAWDRPVIDGDAAARLDAVAQLYARAPGGRLEVTGHADRSGPAAANLHSGQRRAEAVAAYLAARGVPRAAMILLSHGEARPLIPTQDGVREPQNRRVEIQVRRASGS